MIPRSSSRVLDFIGNDNAIRPYPDFFEISVDIKYRFHQKHYNDIISSMKRKLNMFSGVMSSRDGFTLTEVVIASTISLTMIYCVYNSLTVGVRGARIMADHVAAHGLCRDRYEQMRGFGYDAVNIGNFPATNATLTHLNGADSIPIDVTVSNTITDSVDFNDITKKKLPIRKEIMIYATWTQNGKTRTESLGCSIVKRNAAAVKIGLGDGKICLNPNTPNITEFEALLVNSDGSTTTITEDTLNGSGKGFSGNVSALSYQADGSGVQTDFTQDFRTRPLANGKDWYISSSASNPMRVSVSKDGEGKWWASIRGTSMSVAQGETDD